MSEILDQAPTPKSQGAEGGRLTCLVRPQSAIDWPEDIARIRKAMNELGFDASDHDIEAAYAEYSEEELCCGWVVMDIWAKDEYAARATMRYLREPNDEMRDRHLEQTQPEKTTSK